MRPSEPVRHLTSRRNPRPCSTSRRARRRLALARDHHGVDPEAGERLVDLGLAVAAVGGDRAGWRAEQTLDPTDPRGQQQHIGRVALVRAVIEHDPVGVVGELRL